MSDVSETAAVIHRRGLADVRAGHLTYRTQHAVLPGAIDDSLVEIHNQSQKLSVQNGS